MEKRKHKPFSVKVCVQILRVFPVSLSPCLLIILTLVFSHLSSHHVYTVFTISSIIICSVVFKDKLQISESLMVSPSSQQTEDTQKDVSETVSDVKEKDKPPAPRSVPIPVGLFGNHVETNHGSNNQPFLNEFDVRKLVST